MNKLVNDYLKYVFRNELIVIFFLMCYEFP